MPNLSNPQYAATVTNAIGGANNRLIAAQTIVNSINANIAYPQNADPNTTQSYNAELIVNQAKVTGIQAEIAALNAIT
jgi:hypothetical protein